MQLRNFVLQEPSLNEHVSKLGISHGVTRKRSFRDAHLLATFSGDSDGLVHELENVYHVRLELLHGLVLIGGSVKCLAQFAEVLTNIVFQLFGRRSCGDAMVVFNHNQAFQVPVVVELARDAQEVCISPKIIHLVHIYS